MTEFQFYNYLDAGSKNKSKTNPRYESRNYIKIWPTSSRSILGWLYKLNYDQLLDMHHT